MVKHSDPLTIEPAVESTRSDALTLLRLGPPLIRRLLAAHQRGEVDMRGLFLARRGHRLTGAGWGQVVPGRTGVCWPPCLASNEVEDVAHQLQQAVDAYLNQTGVTAVQAIVQSRRVIEAIRLTRAGYEHLADLDYLISTCDVFPHRRPTSGLKFEPLRPGLESHMAEVVERTYQNTLDCSRLDTGQSVQDVLRSYRRTGVYSPQWWFLVRHHGSDIGCILLADHPEHNQCELMYMGIVPEQRGKGWGLKATRYVQWVVGREGRERMVLAVDDANWPARDVYTSAGFRHGDRRSVYIRKISGVTT